MSNICISAIVTTHNRARLLPRALDSVLAQTRPADEVIVIDDGSTDETQATLASRYPAIRNIRQNQSGVSAARNRAIQAASGDWLAFLDDDDAWLPEKLALQQQAIEDSPGYRLCHGDEIWIRNGRRVNPMDKHKKQGGWIYPQCLPRCVISPSCVIIHRSVFTDIGHFDTDLPACEDYDLWLRICAQEAVLFIDQPLIEKYGGHEDQLSRKHWGMDRFRMIALEKMLASNQLNEDNRRLTLETLLEKLTIYRNGAEKRGKHDAVAQTQQRLDHYAALLPAANTNQQNKISCC